MYSLLGNINKKKKKKNQWNFQLTLQIRSTIICNTHILLIISMRVTSAGAMFDEACSYMENVSESADWRFR